ncbi:MAG: Mur ligase domain-containing protein [Rickettsiales bacterium]|jgi:UDP-N-acetylmuramate--alanine ligase|nr:Mur ligase domain-containing protein [Rickettsiales bacterium]
MNKIHFLGINGCGIGGVACLAKLDGFDVSGCDLTESGDYSKQLQDLGIAVEQGHSSKHLNGINMLVVSAAVFFNDKYKQIEEITESINKNIPIVKWQDFLDKFLVEDKKFIAVCGTHGKTSTTTIVANLLEDMDCDPTAMIGGINLRWGTTFRKGNGKYFVCEADEYGGNFHSFHPNCVIFNNVEMEHPEYFANYESYKKNFIEFFSNIRDGGILIFNYDDKNSLEVILQAKRVFVNRNIKIIGFSLKQQPPEDDFIELERCEIVDSSSFICGGVRYGMKNIKGMHNIFNMTAAIILMNKLGFCNKLEKFVENAILPKRRMELVWEDDKKRLYDDYAHHHTQIYYNLSSLISDTKEKRKIIAVLEPHLISRFKQNSGKYLDYMEMADYSIITKFCKSRENFLPDLPMTKYLEGRKTVYIEDFNAVIDKINEIINLSENKDFKFNIVIMGAGSSYKLTNSLKDFYAKK